MLNLSPLRLRLTKDALDYAIDMNSLDSVIALEDRNQVLSGGGADHMAGIRATLEKRDPVWTQA